MELDPLLVCLLVFSAAGTLICLFEVYFLKKLIWDVMNKKKEDDDGEYGDSADWWKKGNKDV